MTTKIFRFLLIAVGILILATMLSFPFGPDQSVAAVGGELSVRHGAIAYKDFIDTKPQIIFWIYGLSGLLFSHHDWAIRIFDILYHIVSLYIFYRVLRRFIKDERVAFISVIVYIIIYVASGFDNTAEAETFALLPSIMLFYFTERTIEKQGFALRYGILAGIFVSLLFLMKFTFIIVGVTSVIYLLLNRSITGKSVFRFCIGQLVSFSVIVGLYAFWLYMTGSFPRFLEAMSWLQAYSRGSYGTAVNAPPGGVHFKMFPGGLLLEYGMTCVILLCIAVFQILKSKSHTIVSYSHLCLQVLAGLMMVYYEGKSWNYHYARFAFAAVPLISFGFVSTLQLIRELFAKWRRMRLPQTMLRIIISIPVFVLAVFYSPLVRIWKLPVHLTFMRFQGQNIAQTIQDDLNGYYYKEQTAASDTLRTLLKPEDQIFLWGRGVGLYYDLDRLPTTICLTSLSMSTPGYTPKSWQQSVLSSLEQMPPRFVIVQEDMTANSSMGNQDVLLNENRSLEVWPDLYNFVHLHYKERNRIGHFQIFERS